MIYKFVTTDKYRKQVCYMSVCYYNWHRSYGQQLHILTRMLTRAGFVPQSVQPMQLQLEAMQDYGTYWYKVYISVKKKWVRIGTLKELGKLPK